MVKTGTKPQFIVLSLIAVMVLLAGCSGKKCKIDSDCGGDYCSNNLQNSVSLSCVEGICKKSTSECSDSEICVASSTGAECLPKDPDSGKPLISCGNNTINPIVLTFNPTDLICSDDCSADSFCNNSCICEAKALVGCLNNTENTEAAGVNVFESRTQMCADDCPGDYYCDDTCSCEEKEEISCNQNTTDTNTFGENIFNDKIERCAIDCPIGFRCNSQCICDEYDCPEPVFTSTYMGDGPFPFDFDFFSSLWFSDPSSILDLGDFVDITAYAHERDGIFHYLPFPEVQLTLVPNPNNDYIPQYGAFCVNDYYEGDEALTIDHFWLTRPEETCIWGPTIGYEGVLTVCTELLYDWLKEYTQ